MKSILLCGFLMCGLAACDEQPVVTPIEETELPLCRDGAVPPSCIEEPAPWPDGKPK